ncbi:MAG: hypothetical protein ACKO1N_08580, partial [Erythrobacter sp.]
MAEGLPVPASPAGLPNAPIAPALPATGWRALLPPGASGLLGQPALLRALPALAGLGAMAAAGALWMTLASGPQRPLYTSLTDAERAKVVATLEAGGIGYSHRTPQAGTPNRRGPAAALCPTPVAA